MIKSARCFDVMNFQTHLILRVWHGFFMYHVLNHHDYGGNKSATSKACWQNIQCDGDASWQSYGGSRETKMGKSSHHSSSTNLI